MQHVRERGRERERGGGGWGGGGAVLLIGLWLVSTLHGVLYCYYIYIFYRFT